jgi:small conductance mechanosensitive channel
MYDQLFELWQWLLTHGARVAIILVVAWLCYRALAQGLARLERRLERRVEGSVGERRDRVLTLMSVFRSVGVGAILLIAGLTLLTQLDINIVPLLASASIVGLALGLGLQALVRDLIGGLFVLLEDQYHIGDAVQLGGVSGTVERITLRATYLRDLDGALHLVPNGTQNIVSNRSSGWARAIVDVSVGYEQNLNHVIAALEAAAQEVNEDSALKPQLLEPLAVAGVEALSPQAWSVRIMGKTHIGQQAAVNRALRQRIKQQFESLGLKLNLTGA